MNMLNSQKNIEQTISITNSEVLEHSSSEKTKRTVKQRLGRLLMITDIKDKTLKPELKHIKDEMYNEFFRT